MISYPLHYPVGWTRTRNPERSAFDPQGRRTILQAYEELERQIDLLGGCAITISTNIPLTKNGTPYSRFAEPADSGAAAYFKLKGVDSAIACDAWDRVKDNLWACAKDIEAIRGRLRWKARTAEQIFAELKYLPPPKASATNGSGNAWWQILKVSPDASEQEIEQSYRQLASYYHPDKPTGNEKMMALVNGAISEARSHIRTLV